MRVTREDGDPRTLVDASCGKICREAVAHGVKSGVGPRRVAADDGGLVRKAFGAPM
jgi:hypothetical protein